MSGGSGGNDNIVEFFVNFAVSIVWKAIQLVLMIPMMIIDGILAATGRKNLTSYLGFKSKKADPVFLENWLRERFKDSDDFQINFTKIQQYREFTFPKDKFPGEWIPVPPNLERGVMYYGKVLNGKMSKADFLTGIAFNPELLADAIDKTKGRALILALLLVSAASIILANIFGASFNLSFTSTESWGAHGTASFFSFGSSLISILAGGMTTALTLLPFLMLKKIALAENDVLGMNEALLDIQRQGKSYGADEASKEEVSLHPMKVADVHQYSKVYAKQLNEFWRTYGKGEPMIYFNKDDGTARAKGSIHGYEAGTEILMSLSDFNMNTQILGRIGSGKTLKSGIPIFTRLVSSLKKAGYPIQGMGLDGKATLYIPLMKKLQSMGVSTEKFIPIGVDAGHYGIPIFHGMSVEKIVDILSTTSKGDPDPFFVPSALSQIGRVVRIAKAIRCTPVGAEYQLKTGGCTTDSPEFVKRLCNNPDILFKYIADLCESLEKPENEDLRLALYDSSLRSAIDGCLEDWKNMLKAEETASSVISTINVFLKPFTDNGKILERFGQGRVGPQYKDLSLALNGHFFFSALADTEFGDAARAINIFARSRVFNLVTLREIEFRKAGLDPQKSPVIIFIDEHQLMVSSGMTGLADASILNISRSMGLAFTAMVQSTDGYIATIGEKQTENMTQQFITKVMLPTTSTADMKRMADTSGVVYELRTATAGVFSTEGAREKHNGGVIAMPNIKIRQMSRLTPIGMPTTIFDMERKVADRLDYRAPFMSLIGYKGKRFGFGSGLDYSSKINSPAAMKKHREEIAEFSLLGLVGWIGNYDLGGDADVESSLALAKSEAEAEAKGRMEGVSQVPLFTNNDLIDCGSNYAVMTVAQFGVEHWCRAELEPDYAA